MMMMGIMDGIMPKHIEIKTHFDMHLEQEQEEVLDKPKATSYFKDYLDELENNYYNDEI